MNQGRFARLAAASEDTHLDPPGASVHEMDRLRDMALRGSLCDKRDDRGILRILNMARQ